MLKERFHLESTGSGVDAVKEHERCAARLRVLIVAQASCDSRSESFTLRVYSERQVRVMCSTLEPAVEPPAACCGEGSPCEDACSCKNAFCDGRALHVAPLSELNAQINKVLGKRTSAARIALTLSFASKPSLFESILGESFLQR